MKKKVVIVDYGLGNIQSAINSVKKALSSENSNNNIVEKTSDYKFIKDASHIILPGQGAFESCIKGLQKLDGMIDELQNQVLVKKKPIFGICVGMQLFATKSFENGEHNGLNWIKRNIIKIQSKKNVLPHMG
jgi:Glutamine amidotransferase